MRNLASCVKVAVDFVLPESLDQAFKFAQDFGNMGKTEAWESEPSSGERVYVDPVNRQHADKLQAELSMCLAAKHAVDILSGKVIGMFAPLLSESTNPAVLLLLLLVTCMLLVYLDVAH